MKEINTLIKTYLIGAMRYTGSQDFGVGWREYITPKLESRGIYVFDPTKEEAVKVGMKVREFCDKLRGWKLSGKWDLYKEHTNYIWKGRTLVEVDEETREERLLHIMGDIDYVLHSTFITAYLAEGDTPCGTHGEAAIAWEHNIPIYLVTSIPKTKISDSFLGWVLNSGGEVFPSFNQYFEHIDQKYQLTDREVTNGNKKEL